jgi:hypothetical protein
MLSVADEIFDCNDIRKFTSTIIRTLYFEGISGSKFYLCEFNGVQFLTKMSFYTKTRESLCPSYKKLMTYTDAEIKILKLFKKKFIDTNITPCILEMVYVTTCKNKDLLDSDEIGDNSDNNKDNKNRQQKPNKYKPNPNYKPKLNPNKPNPNLNPNSNHDHLQVISSLTAYNDKVNAGLAHNKVSFLVLEFCSMTLSKFMHSKIYPPFMTAITKSIIFQLLYTLYVIKDTYPKFKHHDLHPKNILLSFDANYVFSMSNPRYLRYEWGDKSFDIPYFGLIPKLIDFGYSIVPEADIISDIIYDKLYLYDYDIDFELFRIFQWMYHLDFPDLTKLLFALMPDRLYEHMDIPLARKQTLPTYESMLVNPVFSEYSVVQPIEHIVAKFSY